MTPDRAVSKTVNGGTILHTKEIKFPFAKIYFEDKNFPARINMLAFNPFIPLDADNSSIPAAFFEIEVENTSTEEIEYQIAFSVRNPYGVSENYKQDVGNCHMITMKNAQVASEDIAYGDLTIATDYSDVLRQTYWYRGRGFCDRDEIITYWNNFNHMEDLRDRVYDTPGSHDGCTLAARIYLLPKQSQKVRFILSWNSPTRGNQQTWKNYYAVLFKDSAASAAYSLKNWNDLFERTLRFKEALYASTIDPVMIDAISANISILKTPTVLRLEDGSFWGWEGIFETCGSCEGTCQHVWNYAYALCFLFPELERSIRDLEFQYTTHDDGKMTFRLSLPPGSSEWNWVPRACLDGQMGSVIKSYREWKISGNDEWLKKHWNNIVKVLAYAWSPDNPDEWDRNKDGVLEGRQHHTLDKEFFGPSAWLQGMYLAALKAATEMAEYLEDYVRAEEYKTLFESGYQWMKENLFNGSYFIQKLDLKDKGILEHFNCTEYWHEEAEEIKYQMGEGCAIDQMLGQWHCIINGLGNVFDQEQMKIALDSMMKNNYKQSMRDHVNLWRNFSLNDEAGSVICDYPQGTYRPFITAMCSDETMHGFEYSFAGLLCATGRYEDGIKVVKAVRDKYDGKKRNPWNEMECGSNYARSMSCFALLPILSGFEFHLPKKYIGFCPLVHKEDFRSFFSVGSGWGTFSVQIFYISSWISVKINTNPGGYFYGKTEKNDAGKDTDDRQNGYSKSL